ncbi:MAG TPA: ABC transporter ATP-binding protein [Lachnospiraceae bacterium]
MQLEVKNLSKRYGKRLILDEVSLKARAGERIGILGGNGCGKTTLVSILAGILSADGGEVLLDGDNLLQKKKLRESYLSYLPQEVPLIEELTARDNLLLWYHKDTMNQELREGILALLKIPDFLHIRVKKMSGGMKKRLAIACAVANHPKVLLLDEPTGDLDLSGKEEISRYLENFCKMGGIVLMVTHDIYEMEHCDKCYLLKDKKLSEYIFDGDVSSLVKRL